jgi:hypothetical protein
MERGVDMQTLAKPPKPDIERVHREIGETLVEMCQVWIDFKENRKIDLAAIIELHVLIRSLTKNLNRKEGLL